MEKTISQVCEEIAADMEIDAREFDGKPFNGRTVAEYFGNQGAAIAALAKIVAKQEQRILALEQGLARAGGIGTGRSRNRTRRNRDRRTGLERQPNNGNELEIARWRRTTNDRW